MKGFAVLSLCASARAATEQVGADGGGLETSYMKLTKAAPQAGTCGGMKDAYKAHGCLEHCYFRAYRHHIGDLFDH